MTLTEGLGIPSVLWTDSSGRPVNSSDDIMLGDPVTLGQTTDRILSFDPIRTSDEGTYICMATLPSPSLSTLLNSSASYVLIVQQSKIPLFSNTRWHTFFLFTAFPIPVMITNVLVPSQGPTYTPGSTALLMCSAGGGFAPVMTIWTSTCTGDCFVLQQANQNSIMTDILHSVDGGNHTCTVVDDVGNVGSSTIEMIIAGKH